MDDFYIVLLSNGSMRYYPNNTTAHFTTKLPRHIELAGDWSVAMVDIHIPMTFSTVPNKTEDRRVKYSRKFVNFPDGGGFEEGEFPAPPLEGASEVIDASLEEDGEFLVSPGIYSSVEHLLTELNAYVEESHIEFTLNTGSFIGVNKTCARTCYGEFHCFELPRGLRKILGFEDGKTERFIVDSEDDIGKGIEGNTPANIYSNVPTNLLVYTDICKPYITGDVYTRLLRNVALDQEHFRYGGVISKSFSQPIYVPLICPTFETIEIDIRTSTGRTVPFDFGTLTVTLHFRKSM